MCPRTETTRRTKNGRDVRWLPRTVVAGARLVSLDPGCFDRDVRDHATLDEELAAVRTAGLEPSLVQPHQVKVGRAGGALADFRQDVHEADELVSQFSEHGCE